MKSETHWTESGSSPPSPTTVAMFRCGLHPKTLENTLRVKDKRRPRGFSEQCRACWLASQARYRRTEKFRTAKARWTKTEKGRACAARWSKSEKGRAVHRAASERYEQTNKGRAMHAIRGWRTCGIVDLTWARFQAAVKKQRGLCAICCERPTDVCRRWRLDADHDHATGRFRGALCPPCNTRLAKYERGVRFHNRKLNARMREYLKRENVHQLSLALVAR